MIAAPLLLMALAADAPQGKALYRPEAFRTLVDPDCSHCIDEARRRAGELRDDDRVLAWIRGDYAGGAIPYRWFLVPHRVISDTYGVFVYDADADFVRAWPASLDFRFHGWRNGIMALRRKDGTIFDALTGLAVEGPGQGERLAPIAAIETDWGPWLKAHPGTVAYEMKPQFAPREIPSGASAESRQTRPAPDRRLDPDARVFGLALGSAADAWPVSRFGRAPELRRVRVGGQEAYLLWDARTRTAAAYAPEIEGRSGEKVTLRLDASVPEAPWVDAESGSRWSIAGRAVSGPRAHGNPPPNGKGPDGQTLRWLPGVMIRWWAWAAEYPQTALDGRPARDPAVLGRTAPSFSLPGR